MKQIEIIKPLKIGDDMIIGYKYLRRRYCEETKQCFEPKYDCPSSWHDLTTSLPLQPFWELFTTVQPTAIVHMNTYGVDAVSKEQKGLIAMFCNEAHLRLKPEYEAVPRHKAPVEKILGYYHNIGAGLEHFNENMKCPEYAKRYEAFSKIIRK